MSSIQWNSEAHRLVQPACSPQTPAQYCAALTDHIQIVCRARSISDVARITGFNRETVRRYLRGQRPDVEFVAKLAMSLHVSSEWLFLGEGEAYQPNEPVSSLRLTDAAR